MGYLNQDDYSKIKSMIEMFVGNTPKVDNLFKSIVLFLETKNELPIQKETTKIKITPNSLATKRVEKEIERADESLKRFSNKLLKENAKKRQHSRITQ